MHCDRVATQSRPAAPSQTPGHRAGLFFVRVTDGFPAQIFGFSE